MNEKQKANEKMIFDAVQELKDSIFGLMTPYTDFCYSYSEESGYVLDQLKLKEFVDLLADTAKQIHPYKAEFESALPSFFKMTIMFLNAACNSGDWIFVSIRKIGKTVYKNEPGEQSVFDIMVKDSIHFLNKTYPEGSFQMAYNQFTSEMNQINLVEFELCVKHTLERFIDNNGLNTLNDDQATRSIIARVCRTSSLIANDVRRHAVPRR